MKRALALFLTLAMSVTLFAGCGSNNSSSGSDASAGSASASGSSQTSDEHEPLTLNFSMTATMEEHHGACWQTFADYVHEKCPWITIEIHPSATLYDDSTFVDAIMRGNVEMGVTAPGYIGEYAPVTSILAACYIFDDVDQMNSVLNGESWMQMGEALGATPTAMALSEVYLALQSGTIDGQDNPLQATMNYGFGEVTKSITMTNHVIDINWLSISEEIWQSFDEETKAVFMDGFQIAYDECFAAYDGEEADLIAQFREMGVSVYDDVDISTLKEEVWDYYWAHPEISETWDKDLYDAIQNSAA